MKAPLPGPALRAPAPSALLLLPLWACSGEAALRRSSHGDGALSLATQAHRSPEECLEAQRRDPTVICLSATANESALTPGEETSTDASVADGSGTPPRDVAISPVHYPNWRSPECRSDGALFCDPGAEPTMSAPQRANLTKAMHDLRMDSLVPCGRLQNDPVDPWHLQPFYLGIAVLPKWTGPTDFGTMQDFGRLVSSEWQMDQLYVGTSKLHPRCPNTAMLFLLPDAKEAVLASDSCDVLCAASGGPEVVDRARAALRARDGGVYAAALAGAREAYSIVASAARAAARPAAAHAKAPKDPLAGALRRPLLSAALLGLSLALVLGVAFWLSGRRRKRAGESA